MRLAQAIASISNAFPGTPASDDELLFATRS
jgi:hypothetical protein